ncbi:MAG: DUF1573 domain-containing protein [Chitinophagaceae bacterium]
MKYIILFLFVFAGFSLSAQVNFKKQAHKFGVIAQGKPVTHVFTFKNNGAKPVVIETVTADCGCTTPDYPKSPILKAQEGKITVTYNAANPGVFTKKVHVKFAHLKDPIDLQIEGEVKGK